MNGSFDFIEIGTADFDTLIEEASATDRGLSIEPLGFYLNKLPNKPNVVKYQAAVTDTDGFMDIYYIEESKIVEYNLPWWVRGSNSVGKPHPFTVQEIGEELYNKLVTIDRVPTVSWKTLIEKYQIEKIKYLKIDTEGYDIVILNAYLDECEKNPNLYADKIKFECHSGVSNKEEVDKLLTRFKGYSVQVNDIDVNLVKEVIPRIIHQTYKTRALPAELASSVEKLKSMNPTFEYRFYDDQDCFNFIRDNYDQETLDCYLDINPKYGAARADFFRYLLMYKVGGVYLDIKSTTTIPLEETLLITDEYILTHWPGKDWAKELGYEHGEFQNWHIICKPGHPFLKQVIEDVKNNIKNYDGNTGKQAVLRITGPIAYSKAILSLLSKYKTNKWDSPVREYRLEEEVGLRYMNTATYHHKVYKENYPTDEPVVLPKNKHEKAYVLYANENYFETVQACVDSIRAFSKIPIFVYLLNCSKKIEGARTINWTSQIGKLEDDNYIQESGNFYIDRSKPDIYKLLIQRPLVIKDALQKYAETVCYVDSDSVATDNVDRIFDYYNSEKQYPYFVEGIYDYLHVGTRGGAESKDTLHTTLEHPACELFNVNQRIRERYRQTGYFVAGQKTIDFLDEWYWMCINPKILSNPTWYAPYHEETIVNVLLWKYNIQEGLPYIYINGSLDRVHKVYSEIEFTGEPRHIEEWFKIPGKKEDVLFFHGEKNPDTMSKMVKSIGARGRESKKLVYIAPHLSTGGQPQYLLKQIQEFKDQFDIYVIEYNYSSAHFIVQRSQIQEMLGDKFYYLGDNKENLMPIINEINPDIVHLHEVPEFFMKEEIAVDLFNNATRSYFIITTTHSSTTNPSALKFYPDKFVLVSEWSRQKFEKELREVPTEVWEYPIHAYTGDKKAAQKLLNLDPQYKHVLNVGLFTPGKNQGEIFKIARELENEKIKFHFVGNQAGNFQEYWEPLMKDKPANCIVWGERQDVENFYQACDLFYFSSKFELNPLSIKEALSYRMPCIFRRLETYLDSYDNNPLVKYIDDDLEKTKEILLHDLR